MFVYAWQRRISLSVSFAKKSSEKIVHHPVLKPDEIIAVQSPTIG